MLPTHILDRISRKARVILFFPVLFVTSFLTAQERECFLIMVGPEASATGEVLLAHNNDLTGREASFLVKVPAGEAMQLPVKDLPDTAPACSMLVLQTYKGFAEGDAVAVNEYGVAIAGGVSLKQDRNARAEEIDPLIAGGLGGGVRYYALQHARTARECVKIIGALYDRYGCAYPSGVGIADAREMWYLESGGGHMWAAMQIPPNAFFLAANSYNLPMVDVQDTLYFLCSAPLRELALREGYGDGRLFPFADWFGGGYRERTGNNRYNLLRLQRAAILLGSLSAGTPGDTFRPPFHLPRHKISLEQCFGVLRDYYDGTRYNIFSPANRSHPARAIADAGCVHSSVITLTPGRPADYGAVIWTGLGPSLTTVYVPVFFGVESLPPGYDQASPEPSEMSAFWIFRQLADLTWRDYPALTRSWQQQRRQFEEQEIRMVPLITRKARQLAEQSPEKMRQYLDERSQHYAFEAVRLASEKLYQLKQEGTRSNPFVAPQRQ